MLVFLPEQFEKELRQSVAPKFWSFFEVMLIQILSFVVIQRMFALPITKLLSLQSPSACTTTA